MKYKILLPLIMFLSAGTAWAADMPQQAISALWITALLTAVIHTITGPDHYLPFIAIAKSRNYSLKKTLFWTFVCGLGHIGSASYSADIHICLAPA